jgi:cytochrome P450
LCRTGDSNKLYLGVARGGKGDDRSRFAGEVNFFDEATNECPYGAYQVLRDDAPAWWDPRTGMLLVTRYDDVRSLLSDTDAYGNERKSRVAGPPEVLERAQRMRHLYEKKGWVPAATLAGRDDPGHRQMRSMFDHAFRPSRIKALDPFVRDVAHRLIDGFIDAGCCDWAAEFAVPLPLIVIGRQMGAREEDIWRIKLGPTHGVRRLGMMQSEEEERWSVEMEIEAQHYFQEIFDRVCGQPDDSLISDLVNTPVGSVRGPRSRGDLGSMPPPRVPAQWCGRRPRVAIPIRSQSASRRCAIPRLRTAT